ESSASSAAAPARPATSSRPSPSYRTTRSPEDEKGSLRRNIEPPRKGRRTNTPSSSRSNGPHSHDFNSPSPTASHSCTIATKHPHRLPAEKAFHQQSPYAEQPDHPVEPPLDLHESVGDIVPGTLGDNDPHDHLLNSDPNARFRVDQGDGKHNEIASRTIRGNAPVPQRLLISPVKRLLSRPQPPHNKMGRTRINTHPERCRHRHKPRRTTAPTQPLVDRADRRSLTLRIDPSTRRHPRTRQPADTKRQHRRPPCPNLDLPDRRPRRIKWRSSDLHWLTPTVGHRPPSDCQRRHKAQDRKRGEADSPLRPPPPGPVHKTVVDVTPSARRKDRAPTSRPTAHHR